MLHHPSALIAFYTCSCSLSIHTLLFLRHLARYFKHQTFISSLLSLSLSLSLSLFLLLFFCLLISLPFYISLTLIFHILAILTQVKTFILVAFLWFMSKGRIHGSLMASWQTLQTTVLANGILPFFFLIFFFYNKLYILSSIFFERVSSNDTYTLT